MLSIPSRPLPPPRTSERRVYQEIDDDGNNDNYDWVELINCICLFSPFQSKPPVEAPCLSTPWGPQSSSTHEQNGRKVQDDDLLLQGLDPLLLQCYRQAAYKMRKVDAEPPIHAFTTRFQGLCPLGHQEIVFIK